MSEENKAQTQQTVETPELSEEEKETVKAVQTAIASFSSDSRHERYKFCEENRTALQDYMESQKSDWTAETLHTAYQDLSKEGKLILYAESKLKPEPPKVEDKLPPIGAANGSDLGCGLADQARAKQRVEGVAPASNRDAFARAAQKFQNRQVSGSPRLRLG